MSTKKKIVVGMLAMVIAIVGAGVVSKVEAVGVSNTVSLKVTVAPGLSIDVGTATYSFGSLGVNETKISTGAIPVKNDSAGLTEDFRITGANADANWTINNSTNGVNQFHLKALLNTTQPTYANFTAVYSTLSTVIANMSAANYGGNQNGNNVTSGSSLNLWFLLITPTETSSTAQQNITVTLTAADVGTF